MAKRRISGAALMAHNAKKARLAAMVADVKEDASRLSKRVHSAIVGVAPPTRAEVKSVKSAARDVSAEAAKIAHQIAEHRENMALRRYFSRATCKDGKTRAESGRCRYPNYPERRRSLSRARTAIKPCGEGRARSRTTNRCSSSVFERRKNREAWEKSFFAAQYTI